MTRHWSEPDRDMYPLRRLAAQVVGRAIRDRDWPWFETANAEFWLTLARLDVEAVRSQVRADAERVYQRLKRARRGDS